MGNAFILIVVGLLIMYAVVSDKFFCLEGCWNCLKSPKGSGVASGAVGGSVDLGGPVRGAAGSKLGPLNYF